MAFFAQIAVLTAAWPTVSSATVGAGDNTGSLGFGAGVNEYMSVLSVFNGDISAYSIEAEVLDIMGTVISGERTIVASGITTGGAQRSAVAADTLRDQYLVVWPGDGSPEADLFGLLLSREGTAIGSAFPIVDSALTDELEPRAAYDPISDQFLVVYTSYDSGSEYDVYGQRVKPDGSLTGNAFAIAAAAGNDETLANVAANLNDGGWLVTYLLGIDAKAKRVSAAGAVLDSSPIAVTTGLSGTGYRPGVAFDPVSGHFLVAHWNTDQIYSRVVAANGTMPSGADLTGALGTNSDMAVANSVGAGKFKVAWRTSGNSTGSDIFGRSVTTGGVSSGSEGALADDSTLDLFGPTLAGNDYCSNFILSYMRSGPPVVAQYAAVGDCVPSFNLLTYARGNSNGVTAGSSAGDTFTFQVTWWGAGAPTTANLLIDLDGEGSTRRRRLHLPRPVETVAETSGSGPPSGGRCCLPHLRRSACSCSRCASACPPRPWCFGV